MHTLTQLQKQQVGLRLPTYLLEDLDEFTKVYSLNRSEIIVEAIKSYIEQQKSDIFYQSFDKKAKELKQVLSEESPQLQTLDELINELENS